MLVTRRTLLKNGALMAAGLLTQPSISQAAAGGAGFSSEIGDAARSAIKAGACPGVSVHVSLHGQALLSNHYGLANIETDSGLASSSVFRIGSLTKQFTAALVVKLASEGKLDLDDAVSRHLPCFEGRQPFTVRELLNHTAGLHSDEQNVSCQPDPARPKSQMELAQEISAQSTLFDFEPGTAWLYSNANYIVLGAVIEKLTARSLADTAAALIFKPLGLDKTAFDSSDAVVPGRVDGYSPVDGSPGSFTHPPFIEISEAGGAGAMRSTASDLGRWHRALFENRLFDRRFVDVMIAPGRLRDGRLSGENRFSPDDASYGDIQYGMGLLVSPSSKNHRSVLHYGFINGFSAFLETYVDLGLTTVILCNGDVGPALPFRAMRKIVAARFLKT